MGGSTGVIDQNRGRAGPWTVAPVGAAIAARGAAAAGDPVTTALARARFGEFELAYDVARRILFCSFTYTGRPCFGTEVLREALEIQRLVRGQFGDPGEREPAVRFLVLGSRAAGVWSLGLDGAHIAALIRKRDRVGLRRYAHACCAWSFANATGLGFELPVVSVALVQGDALGGGFEAVLSSNLIVAERSVRFGLPDMLFRLFPGMGGLSFLARRIAPGLAERLIASGEILTAEQLHQLGVVDVLAPDGEGMAALDAFIGPDGNRHPALRALYRARRVVNPVTLEELTRIADLWVESAFRLEESDLRQLLERVTAPARPRPAG